MSTLQEEIDRKASIKAKQQSNRALQEMRSLCTNILWNKITVNGVGLEVQVLLSRICEEITNDIQKREKARISERMMETFEAAEEALTNVTKKK